MTAPSKWSQTTTIIALLIAMVGLQMGGLILGITNSVNGHNRETRLQTVEDNYVKKKDLAWVLKTYDAEVESMMLKARQDSAAAFQIHKIYTTLRNEHFEIKMDEARGSSTGGKKQLKDK